MALQRKIEEDIKAYLSSDSNKMMIIDGARQVGKSFIIRQVGKELFPNYIEINMEADKLGDRVFAEAKTVRDFYLALSIVAGDRMKDRANTLVFIDEIQAYDHLLTLVKFLMSDRRFTFIASGSLLGVTLKKTQSIPIGSIIRKHMYPLDFEEFLWANGVGEPLIQAMKESYENRRSLPESIHTKLMSLFRSYLLTGGMPDAVNTFLSTQNIVETRQIQTDIHELYGDDAAKYEQKSARKLKIMRIYRMIPSNMENKKKRIVAKEIEGKQGKRMTDYLDEFEYLISSGVALEVKAISKPSYPLVQNSGKNLLKLYLNDVGLLTDVLYGTNVMPILKDIASINLGSVYESVVAQELRAHGHGLFYYDNKKLGEVDYLIDDQQHLSVVPIEVKSGKDYKVHSALDRFLSISEYNIHQAFVLSNERRIYQEQGITYLPIYDIIFL